MPHLTWSPGALADLSRLRDFLLAKSPSAAVRAMIAIRRDLRLLLQFPAAGRPAFGRGPEYRELIVPFGSAGYIVLYRLVGTDILIAAIRHSREADYPGLIGS